MAKKFSYKNIFYIFFAVCTIFAGLFVLNNTNSLKSVKADVQVEDDLENTSPYLNYLSRQEFVNKTELVDESQSFLSKDVFAYYDLSDNENSLKLSLKLNDIYSDPTNIMHYVYFPDINDQNHYVFYSNIRPELTRNGTNFLTGDNLHKTFVSGDESHSFQNYNTPADTFEMIFNSTGSKNNELNILDENGVVQEGLYSLKLTFILISVTVDASGEQSFDDQEVEFYYNFFIVDRNSYFSSNRPQVENVNFDRTILGNSNISYYLYSNYSAKKNSSDVSNLEKNGAPYIKFDSERFDVKITKLLDGLDYTTSVLYDTENTLKIEGDFDITSVIKNEEGQNKTYIYFQDVGNYTVYLSAITLVGNQKYALDAISDSTKDISVYMYGFQFGYTDLDAEPNENNVQPKKEMRKLNTDTNVFEDSADITSEFLNSDPSFNQNSATSEDGNTTFRPNKFLTFIEDQKLTPVKTNQTPIEVMANAELLKNESYIYSLEPKTNWNTDNTILVEVGGESKQYYYQNFTGRAVDEEGIYVYLIAYTFSSYRDSENSFAQSRIFYQLFYFEIDKTTPRLNITTVPLNEGESAKDIQNGQATNHNVKLELLNNSKYNKKLTVQIYAKDFNDLFVSEINGKTFDAQYGISLSEFGTDITLTGNAHYYVRLYYSSDLKNSNVTTHFDMKDVATSEVEFIIDNTPISDIRLHNVVQNATTQQYRIVSDLAGFSTNQNVALSWQEKASKIKTYAYYRKFDMVATNMYSNDETNLHAFINSMYEYGLPANSIIQLSKNAEWLRYKGNSRQVENQLTSEYLFKGAGLYFLDLFDEAGNHSYQLFMIDNSTPVIAIYDKVEERWKLTNESTFIDSDSTLFWGDSKNLLLNGLDTTIFSKQTVDESDLKNVKNAYIFQNRNKEADMNLFNLLKARFYNTQTNRTGNIRLLSSNISPSSGEGVGVSDYNGLYLLVPISNVVYMRDIKHPLWQARTFETTHHQYEIDATEENNYTFLFRDESNTKRVDNNDELQNYVNYFSASATIIVSFDESEFFIRYGDSQTILTPIFTETGSSTSGYKTLTSYLSPSKMETPFYITFIPTSQDSSSSLGDQIIQIDKVTMEYYAFVKVDDADGNHYYDFATTSTISQDIYSYDKTPEYNYETVPEMLNPDTSTGYTRPGKYILKRTYKTGDNFSFNPNDYFERTYVLIIDRFEVITNAESPDNQTRHSESYVGGDIFVAVFDSGNDANLVVTFPDSPDKNSKGKTLYNNQSPEIEIISQTTNKLPVNVYVPAFKYTKYASLEQPNPDENAYNFSVENNAHVNHFVEDKLIVPEYVLYAEIKKVVRNSNGTINQNSSRTIATTSKNAVKVDESGNIILDGNATLNEFLIFFDDSGNVFSGITESGVYHVTIYQGYFGLGFGENSFQQNMTFQFEVTEAQPDFDVSQEGEVLYSDRQNEIQTYYTNQPELLITWQKAKDEYEIDIDIEKITYTTSRNTTSKKLWENNPPTEQEGTGTYLGFLDLSNVSGDDIYQNNSYIDITMQFKNHENSKDKNGRNLYRTITKRIFVDLSAPSTNVENLATNSISTDFQNKIKKEDLREYKKAFGTSAPRDLDETSYNVSKSSGNFAYYSYMVQESYIDTLISNNEHKVYIRKFTDDNGNPIKYDMENHAQDQETTPNAFSPSNFVDLTSNRNFNFEAGNYYEIVERDKARNMAIYTIYVTSYSDSDQNLIEYVTTKDDDLVLDGYTIEDYNLAKRSNAINNIFSHRGFELKNINYFGDDWAQIKFNGVSSDNYRVSLMLMKTPYYKDGLLVFNLDGSIENMSYKNLIDGSFNFLTKASLNIFNRENKTSDNFYIFVNSTLSLEYQLTQDSNLEYIEITNQPTNAQILSTTNGFAYLTKMTIKANGNNTLYEVENKLGLVSLNQQNVQPWSSSSYPSVKVTLNNSSLKFDISSLQSLTSGTRINYTFEDNFGQTYYRTHYFKEAIISREFSAQNHNIYLYQDDYGNDIYIAEDDIQFHFNSDRYSVVTRLKDETGAFVTQDLQDRDIVYDGNNAVNFKFDRTISTVNGITTWTFSSNELSSNGIGYHLEFELEIIDKEERNSRKVYFTLYNELPKKNLSDSENQLGQYKIVNARGTNITSEITQYHPENYYSEVSIQFLKANTFIPVKYYLSKNKTDWREILSGETLRCSGDVEEIWYLKIWYDASALNNKTGYPEVFSGSEIEDHIYQINLSPLTANYWVVRKDGNTETIVERSKNSYTSPNGKPYQIHYIINMQYSAEGNPVEIRVNQEQNLVPVKTDQLFDNGNQVYSELWEIRTKEGSLYANIVISYVPNKDEIVEHFYATMANKDMGTENLIRYQNQSLIIPENELNKDFDRMTIQWSRWYGFKENEILIDISKDGIKLNPTIFYKKQTMNIAGNLKEIEFSYIVLTYSGKYLIQFHDLAGNTQRFNVGKTERTSTFTFTFLKDVPFKVSWNDGTTQSQQNLLIDQQIFNGPVTLHLDPSTRTEYFSPNAVNISVKRNGEEYIDENFKDTTNDFTFNNPGNYEITFSASSAENDVDALRQQTYSFTIINPSENKIAYVFNKYSNYYVEKVIKDGEDITERLLKTMDIDTIKGQDGKNYLSMLPLSCLDQKTGAGVYEITINSNNKLLQDMLTRFSFVVRIKQTQNPPITISVSEGDTTTKSITVSFNQQNIYEELGQCQFRIVRDNGNGTFSTMATSMLDIKADSEGTFTSRIADVTGTFYIQFVTPSEYLLFSYKVIRKSPMNAASIIAIVISAIVLVLVIVIIIKLRKRISIK